MITGGAVAAGIADHRDERRGPIRLRWPLGWLAKSQYQGVASPTAESFRQIDL